MAPLKRAAIVGSIDPQSMYPWLRGHGSIEAVSGLRYGHLKGYVVSMAERSWLH